MADDPHKKGADAKRISQQPHEQAYQRRKQREANEGSKSNASGSRTSGSKDSGRSDTSGRSSSRSK